MNVPILRSYHHIVVNISGGKDSQAMLDEVVRLADAEGVRNRITATHASLGRMEWPGTLELAAEHAAHYGVRFEVVQNDLRDLLAEVEQRGKWPGPTTRYCTSNHKRGPVLKLMTRLAKYRLKTRILNCMGMRAQESTSRARLRPFTPAFYEEDGKPKTTPGTSGRKAIDVWLPIHDWTVDQVWDRIRQSGVRHHPAYDLGMPRLSCVFCFYSPRAALIRAGHHNLDLLREYVNVERKVNHTFKKNLSLASVLAAVEAGEDADTIDDWEM